KEKLVGSLERAFQAAHGFNGVIWLRASSFKERRHQTRFLRAGKSHHGIAMLEFSQLAFLFVGRNISRRQINDTQVEAVRGCPGDRQVSAMDGIECPAKQGYPHAVIRSSFS